MFLSVSENDFNGGSTLLESQAGMDVSVQIEITEDEREELDEIFLVILETESDNGLQPLMHTVLRDGVEVNETVCAVGIILESDRDGKLVISGCYVANYILILSLQTND